MSTDSLDVDVPEGAWQEQNNSALLPSRHAKHESVGCLFELINLAALPRGDKHEPQRSDASDEHHQGPRDESDEGPWPRASFHSRAATCAGPEPFPEVTASRRAGPSSLTDGEVGRPQRKTRRLLLWSGLALVVMMAFACGRPPCEATCSGCCDAQGTCAPGLSTLACGIRGAQRNGPSARLAAAYTSYFRVMYVAPMIRTQIYLDEGLQQALRSRSAAEGRSVAALIREAVAHFLKPKKRNFKPRN